MAKTGLTGIILGITALFVTAGSAFATVAVDQFEMYITDQTGNPGTQPNRSGGQFQLSETPYLFIHSPVASPFDISWWDNPNNIKYGAFAVPDANGNAWMTLWGPGQSNPDKTLGQWTVGGTNNVGNWGSTSFSYAPEPISSALFLLGGGALAARAFRRRKTA